MTPDSPSPSFHDVPRARWPVKRQALLTVAALATALSLPMAESFAGPRGTGGKRRPSVTSSEQKAADRHFKSGVVLFAESKFAEALAEFERAYELAPHPLVLYNIAGCHRELSQYAEAVRNYQRFLVDGRDQVPAARLTAAQSELDGILARIARLTVTVAPEGATLYLDDDELGTLVEMPLLVRPGEHRLVAKMEGRADAVRIVRVASGDALTIDLSLAKLPPSAVATVSAAVPAQPDRKRLTVGAGFGSNLLRADTTGAPTVGLGYALTERLQLGLDAAVVAFALVPSLRMRLVGDRFSLHAFAAVPVSFASDEMDNTVSFVAGAVGVGMRYRITQMIGVKAESMASLATRGFSLPTFLGGELWF